VGLIALATRRVAGNGRLQRKCWADGLDHPPRPGTEPLKYMGIAAHPSVYTVRVKRRDLEQRLSECGWRFLRSGGRHDIWTDGEKEEAVPRHSEINEQLARAILRRACGSRK
jgi:mRNA interferase HicA